MNILDLILDASIIVQLVLVVLLLMSVYVWLIIFAKLIMVNKLYKQSKKFHLEFRESEDLLQLFRHTKKRPVKSLSPLEHIFVSGFEEYAEQTKTRASSNPTVACNLILRKMQQTYNEQMDVAEDRTAMLATIGSSAPYIGLFGTVWGIMDSFQALGSVKHATLTLVAPGISEALIATAMGLFVAIPAVISFNRFTNTFERLSSYNESFIDEFMRLVEKQLH